MRRQVAAGRFPSINVIGESSELRWPFFSRIPLVAARHRQREIGLPRLSKYLCIHYRGVLILPVALKRLICRERRFLAMPRERTGLVLKVRGFKVFVSKLYTFCANI